MYQLSYSSLSVFKDNPLCFYKEKRRKIKRPSSPFSSLPTGIDKILKEFFDYKRGELPEEMQHEALEGYTLYEDMVNLNRWRNWKSGLTVKRDDRWKLVGAFDDLLYSKEEGLYMMLDYKTTGKAPDKGYSEKYYQTQADCYSLLLQENGYDVDGLAAFIYYYPEMLLENDTFSFGTQFVIVQADPQRALDLCEQAFACLDCDTPPAPNPGNQWDHYIDASAEVLGAGTL